MKQLLNFLLFVPSLCLAQAPEYVSTDGLLGWYPLDGNALDLGPLMLDGTVNGPVVSEDRFEQQAALFFDGLNDHLSLPQFTISGDDPRTFSFWIKAHSNEGGGYALSYGPEFVDGGCDAGNHLEAQLGDCQMSGIGINVNCTQKRAETPEILDNAWHHIAMVYAEGGLSGVQLWLDGSLLPEPTCTQGSFSSSLNTSNQFGLTIGRRNYDAYPGFFGGSIDDLGIWNRALTNEEILALYEAEADDPICVEINPIGPDTILQQTGSPAVIELNLPSSDLAIQEEWYNTYSANGAPGGFARAFIRGDSIFIAGATWPGGTTDQLMTCISSNGDLIWQNVRSPGGDHDGFYSVWVDEEVIFLGSQNAQGTSYFDAAWVTTDHFGNEQSFHFAPIGGTSLATELLKLESGALVAGHSKWPEASVLLINENHTVAGQTPWLNTGMYGNPSLTLSDEPDEFFMVAAGSSTQITIRRYNDGLEEVENLDVTIESAVNIYDATWHNGVLYLVGKTVGADQRGYILKVDSSGVLVEYTDPSSSAFYAIHKDPDGQLWTIRTNGVSPAHDYTELGRVDQELTFTSEILLQDGSPFVPYSITGGSQGLYIMGTDGSEYWQSNAPAVSKVKYSASSSDSLIVTWSNGATASTIEVEFDESQWLTVNLQLGECSWLDSVYVEIPIENCPDTSYTYITACDSVVWNGTTYFESGTYSCSDEPSSNYALSFDGVDDFIQLGYGSLLPSNSITIMTWFNSSGVTSGADDIFVSDVSWSTYTVRMNDAGHIGWRIQPNPGSGGNVTNVTTLGNGVNYSDNNWHNLACTWDGSHMNMFIDGNQIPSNPIPTSFSTVGFTNDNATIGAYPTTNEEFFHGQLDEFQIWNTALTESQIQHYMSCAPLGNEPDLVGYWNFDEGNGIYAQDQTSNGNDGNITGATYIANTPTQSCPLTNINGSESAAVLNLTILPCDAVSTFCGEGTVWDSLLGQCIALCPVSDTVYTLLPSCGPGTIWDPVNEECIVTIPADINFDGCVTVNDLLELLAVHGTCPPYPEWPDEAIDTTWACGDPLTYWNYDYATVLIGDQCWFAENLRNSLYSNGDTISLVLDNDHWLALRNDSTGGTAFYDNDESNGTVFGALYNGFAVLDDRSLCPDNWGVPADLEWQILETQLGMPINQLSTETWRGNAENVGQAMKVTTADSPPWNGTNASLWNGLPAGYRHPTGTFNSLESIGLFWSRDLVPGANSLYAYLFARQLSSPQTGIKREREMALRGFSVRCLKDAE